MVGGVVVKCSVWNWETLQYDYYEVPGAENIGGWKPLTGLGMQTARSASRGGSLGSDVEERLPRLPAGARKIGAGVHALGTLCQAAVGGLGLPSLPSLPVGANSSVAMGAALGFVGGYIVGGLKGGMMLGIVGFGAGYALGRKGAAG